MSTATGVSLKTANQSHSSTSKKKLTIALAGNPNAGKTTLFNALTGMRQKVANYPGVTVERKEGTWNSGDFSADLIDLPGLYSLDAASLDEQIARDVLTGKIEHLPKPDIVIAVADATNLERNLYLITQLLEYKIPIVVVLSMIDRLEKTIPRSGSKNYRLCSGFLLLQLTRRKIKELKNFRKPFFQILHRLNFLLKFPKIQAKTGKSSPVTILFPKLSRKLY